MAMDNMLLASLVFAAVMFFMLGLRSRRPKLSHLDRVMGPQSEELEQQAADRAMREKAAEQKPLGWLGRLELEAKRAGLNITPIQLLAMAVAVGALVGGVAYTLIPIPIVGMGASFLGLLAPRYYISVKKNKRAEDFSKSLDGALMLMAQSMKAGASLSQAISRAAEKADEPVRSELMRAAKVIKLGTAVEALEQVNKRVESKDWELVVIATQILERTGGNLAEVYERIAETIRQRRMTRRAVLAHTAQIRMQANMLSIFPIAITLFLRVINPDYFTPMLSSPLGLMLFVGSFAMIGVGYFWIRNMVTVSGE